MSIYALRTVCIRPVLPPKPEPKVLAPKLSMADDAKACNRRMRKINGNTPQATAEEFNLLRQKEAIAERTALAMRACELLAVREMTSTKMATALGVSENKMRNALGLMKADGMADYARKGGLCLWRLS